MPVSRPPRLLCVLLALLVATTGTRTAAAEPSEPTEPTSPAAAKPVELRINLPVDLGITLGGGVLWLGSEALANTLAPKSCRWCDRNADGSDSLNGFDSSARRALRWNDTTTAATLSGVFSYVLTPSVATGVGALVAWHDDRLRELPEDLLLVAEASVIAGTATQITKFSLARERPYVHARSPSERALEHSSADDVSFFSGHATQAFALAVSAGTVASMRKYRLAPVMWVAGLTFAAMGAYLRIAADKHYASDVLVGTVVGSSIGFAVPYFAHRPLDVRVGALAVEDGHGFALWGRW